ncbi:MAG: lipase family protein [Rhodococcus sp. (in: high G+C Gram-positive bacteria)]|uniref:lipase family protein n=1 Tax=Rhodococcus sp. TaxID=1831 RepID=UPI002AD9F6AF|nr:lipase family protein [Rhodococcus sp. (in: high G+C Gram-positive bacteria)]MDZ7931648.1 lipase family protein [Rhodococcus sp. (in: high G+C Gram-positive bacteria)]
MRTTRHAGTVLAVVAAVLVGGSGVAAANPGFPPSFPLDQNQLPQLPTEPQIYDLLPIPVPDQDPWYDDPSNIADYVPGQIVRSRDVQTRLLGIPFPVYTRQLLYRSTDVHGGPIVTATSVIVPGIPWVGGPRPVVSYQEAIDSTDSSCNPSHTLQVGTMKESTLLAGWLAQGFAINVPDFDGKFNTFNTFDEGNMVLDSIRAVKNDTSLGLAESRFALYGYSGGGSASIRAAELRQSYAPDVELVGTAFGGTPADLTEIARYALEPRPGLTGISSFLMWLGLASLSREYPEEFDTTDLLTVEGQQIVNDLQSRCVYTAAVTGMYRPMSEYFQPGKSLATEPGIMRVLADNSLGKSIPDSPLLWWHGVWDELVPPSGVLSTVQKYWDAGADLRFYTTAPEHIVATAVSYAPALAWISAVLRGLPPGPKFKADVTAPLPADFPGS